MPEGHTTHRIARDIRKDLGGQVLSASSPQGRVADLAAAVDGLPLAKTEAYGKHLALHCGATNSGAATIIHVHLGLIGKFTRVPADTPPRDTIRLRLQAAASQPTGAKPASVAPADTIWDLTAPNTCELINLGEWDQITAQLGPDPLRRGSGPNGKACAAFVEKLMAKKAPLAAVLLDQSVTAGIGNVFRSELSFLLGVDPRSPANSLTEKQTKALWVLIVEQLQRGVRLNRIVTLTDKDAKDGAGTTPGRLPRSESLYVYKRDTEPCRRCGTPIQTSDLAGRRIWWCPTCQA